MYSVYLLEGEITCETFEHTENGIERYDEDDDLLAFVPYANLQVVINDETYVPDEEDERSFM